MSEFDLAVIGAGPGGYVAAIRASQLGMSVALIEKEERLGGTCLNVGCIPSKALLETSEHYALAGQGFADHGIRVEGLSIDVKAMMARKARIVESLTDGIRLLMKKGKVEVVRGSARLRKGGGVAVEAGGGPRDLDAAHVLLATGSVPVELPFLPYDGSRVVTSTEALSFGAAPESMVVVGAGAVGLELGSVWNRLGTKVTVVEMLPRIVPFADAMVSRMLLKSLKAQGLDVRVGWQVAGAGEAADGSFSVRVQGEGGAAEEIACEKVLVAVGRRPNTSGCGLEEAGVAMDGAGRIRVDDRFRTNVPGVLAIGDLIAGPMLAHKASEEGVAAVERMAGKAGHVNYGVIPNVVYTAPELAQVGKTEEQVKEEGVPYKVGRSYFKGNGRALSMGEGDGLVKVIAHKETDRLLGVHILGPRASELVGEAVTAMEFGGSAEDLGRMVHAHPTLSEALKEASLAVDRTAIHG